MGWGGEEEVFEGAPAFAASFEFIKVVERGG